MFVELDPGERRMLKELHTTAEYAEAKLEAAANGYGKGRSDDRSGDLREARDAAKALKDRVGKIIA